MEMNKNLMFTSFVNMDSLVFHHNSLMNESMSNQPNTPVFHHNSLMNESMSNQSNTPVLHHNSLMNESMSNQSNTPVLHHNSLMNESMSNQPNTPVLHHNSLMNESMSNQPNTPVFHHNSLMNGSMSNQPNTPVFHHNSLMNGSMSNQPNTPVFHHNSLMNGSMNNRPKTSVLSAHDISYEVKVDTKCSCRKTPKQILSNVTGVFKQGLTAVMGATGSGKSTFLDILASRKDPRGTSGHLLLDGKPIPGNFKHIVGYVVQDDVVVGTLTVRENLQFSAALRLPTSVKTAQRNSRVENVIKELGLTKCADMKIGTVFLRGVSGGERKRCCIGMELIISPSMLFLDEPTTGLDADTALTVAKLLKKLSKRGRTIIFSIHQPRYSIFSLFDNLLLLSEGHVVYNGPSDEALDFFATQGFRCPVYNNPPDFFLDVINGHGSHVTEHLYKEKEDDHVTACVRSHKKLVTGFKHSRWNTRLQIEAQTILKRYMDRGIQKLAETEMRHHATSFFNESKVLAGRSLKNIFRDPQSSVFPILVAVVFGVILDAIYWRLGTDPATGFKDRSGVLFFLIVNQFFLNITALETFKDDRKNFMHEHISGFYRVSSYFLVKVVFDILPVRTAPIVVISCLVYFLVGLNPGADHFFLFLLSLFCSNLASAGVSFFYSSFFRVHFTAQVILSLTLVLMILFGTYFVNINSVGPWLNWAQYLSIFKYSSEALHIIEFKDHIFCDSNATICKAGNEYLAENGISFRESWDFWSNHVALLIIAAGTFIFTYIQLRCMKKTF